jgi:outer membrane protein
VEVALQRGLSFGLALATLVAALPGRSAELSLEQVLDQGLPNSASLELARRQLASSEASLGFSRSLRLPQLNLVGSTSFTQVGTTIGVISNLPTMGDLSLGLNQNGYALLQSSFAGGGLVLEANLLPLKEAALVAAATEQTKASRASLSEAQRQVRFDLESAYRELQLRQALVPVWESALQASTALEKDAQEFHRRGLAARIDLLRSKALRAADRQGLAGAKAQLAAAQARLGQLLALPLSDPPSAKDPITSLAEPWPLDLASSVERALAQRPLLEALALRQRASEQQARAARAGLLPSLSLLAGAGFNGNRIYGSQSSGATNLSGAANLSLPGFSGNGSLQGSFYDWGAMLLVRQPLFDGGRARGAAAVASQAGAVLEADGDLARRQIRQAVASTWENLRASTETIAAGKEAVGAAKLALRDAQLRYRAQVEALTEVLLVQRDLQVARSALLTAQVQQALDRALLERETGGPP